MGEGGLLIINRRVGGFLTPLQTMFTFSNFCYQTRLPFSQKILTFEVECCAYDPSFTFSNAINNSGNPL